MKPFLLRVFLVLLLASGSPLAAGQSTDWSGQLARVAAQPDGPPGGLTDREAEVLALIAQGYTNPEIAERLVLSVRTVETHRSAIHRKIGTTNRAALVRYAREHNLIDLV